MVRISQDKLEHFVPPPQKMIHLQIPWFDWLVEMQFSGNKMPKKVHSQSKQIKWQHCLVALWTSSQLKKKKKKKKKRFRNLQFWLNMVVLNEQHTMQGLINFFWVRDSRTLPRHRGIVKIFINYFSCAVSIGDHAIPLVNLSIFSKT